MRPGSKRASVTLHNLSEKPQTLSKGAVIAKVQAANLIPPKLAPRMTNTNNNNDNSSLEYSPEHIEKLFSQTEFTRCRSMGRDKLTKAEGTICQVPPHIRFRRP